MIPVKVRCECGQKYAFEVEPVGGRMGNLIACPVCGVDGTAAANLVIAQFMALESDREQGLRISAWKPTTPAPAQPLQNLASAPIATHP